MGKSKDLATGETWFVNTSGDSMTGALSVSGGANSTHLTLSGSANRGLKISTSNPDGQNDGTVILNAQDTEASGVYAKMSFQTAGTERMKIDNVGRVTTPSQPFFMGRNFASVVGSDKASFSNIQQNGSHWNNSTGYFTCPTAGEYLVIASSGYKATDAYLGWGIKYNNSVDLYGWSSYLTNHAHSTQCISYIKKASANDTFAAYIAPHSSYTTPYVGNNYCAFSVYLLG